MRYLVPCLLLVLVVGCTKPLPTGTLPMVELKAPTVTLPTDVAETKKVYTRAEFEKLVIGKTQEEVLKAVGKPVNTSNESWTFRNLTKDPVNDKVDYSTVIYFENGKVDRVVH